MNPINMITSLGVVILATTILAPSAMAQSWPTKPIRIVVAFPPGAPGDIIARLIQPDLQTALGQPILVDNKPGAGGNIGAQEVSRATDGHTFLVGPDTMLTINPHLYKKLSFKPTEDLIPVTLLASFNQMLVCHPATGIRNVADLVAKTKASTMNYASGGSGVPGHMAMEMFLAATGTQMDHIPYKGPAPAAQDVLGGQVPCGFLAAPVVGPHVKDNRLTALGVSGSNRSPGSSNVPTMAETGVAGFDATFFEILAAPKGTSPNVLERLQKSVAAALNQNETRNKLLAVDLDPVANTSAQAQQRIRSDAQKWGKVAEKINLQLD
jgi:tripartite-type tricarboxylate transporter receptor subunit TctC